MHTNKKTTSKTSKVVKTNNNDDEIFVGKGQGFLNWFDSIRINKIFDGSDWWIPGKVNLKHTDESTEYDVEKIRVAKTVGSNEVESEELSTANEEEIDSKSKRSKKIPTRYLNYELD